MEHIRAGTNTLAIRIYSPTAPLAVLGGSLWTGPIDLAGKWFAKVERTFPELAPEAMQSAPQSAAAAAKARFEKFDANKDGFVTREEFITQGGKHPNAKQAG